MELYVIYTALFTPILYYSTYRSKCDISYLSYSSFLGLGSPLGSYLLLYTILGGTVAWLYSIGFDVLNTEKQPADYLKDWIIPGKNPPDAVKEIVSGFIVACLVRATLSLKPIPFTEGTLDSQIETRFFEKLKDVHQAARLKGTVAFSNSIIASYKKEFASDLTIPILAKNLRRYFSLGESRSIANEALIQDLETREDILAALTMLTHHFDRRKIKAIVWITPTSDELPHEIFTAGRLKALAAIILMGIAGWVLYIRLSPTDEENKIKIATRELQKAVPQPIAFSAEPNGEADFLNYFKKSNKDFFDRINQGLAEIRKGTSGKTLFLLHGPQGEGKSTLIDHLQDVIPRENLCIVRLGKYLKTTKKDDDFVVFKERARLVINQLPTLLATDPQGLLKGKFIDRGFYVIDDLDECNNEGLEKVMEGFKNFISSRRGFQAVIFVGQSEVFADNRRRLILEENFKGEIIEVPLLPPNLKTLGDLRSRVTYFSASEPQGSVWSAKKHELIANNLYDLIRQDKDNVLCQSIQNLYLSNLLIIEAGRERFDPNISFKRLLFYGLLDRAQSKYDRPSEYKTDHLELYLKMLSHVAHTYHKVDGEGYFVVHHNSELDVKYEGGKYSFKPYELLNRSGLTVSKSYRDHSTLVKFSPFWVHEYLLKPDEPGSFARPREGAISNQTSVSSQ